MSHQSLFSSLATSWVALPSLAVFLAAFPARAQNSSADYIFLVGSGFICDQGDSSTCPAIAKANAGDTYEMSGAGTFDAQSKSVKAAGPYAHKSPNGNVLEAGVWTASELVSFDFYGAAPSALAHRGMAFGSAAISPKRMPMSRGPMPTGGLAVFRILLVPMSGPSTTAVLQVNCALGDVPREHSVEGVRLTVERNNSEYSEEISGRVMFLSIRLEMSTPLKTPQEQKAPENSQQPHN